MTNDAVRKVFRNESSGYVAVHLEDALDRVVKTGIKLVGTFRRTGDKDLFLQALENKAVPVIRGILRTINPEMLENISGIEERTIWRIYWDIKNDPLNANISIFVLIAELNSNPPLTAVAA